MEFGGQRVRAGGHEAIHFGIRINATREDLEQHIALGEDADQAWPVADQDRLATVALHGRDRVRDAGTGRERDRVAVPQRLELLAAQLAARECLVRVAGPLRVGHVGWASAMLVRRPILGEAPFLAGATPGYSRQPRGYRGPAIRYATQGIDATGHIP